MIHAFLVMCTATIGGIPVETEEDRASLLSHLERALQGLEAADRDLPRDTFDVDGVISLVGRDPTHLFEWVRDQTTLLPYQGILKGARGVLMDRAGNSLDRSLLLAALLGRAGYKARLAHATLTGAQGHQVLATAARDRNSARANANDAKQQQPALTADEIDGARGLEDAQGRIEESLETLRGAVQLEPEEPGAMERDALAAIRDHWWAQVELLGAWVSLDPCLDDAKPGQEILEASAFVAAPSGSAPIALDAKLYHEVELRIVAERFENGARTEKEVVSAALRAADLIAQTITLDYHPLSWPAGLKLGGDKASGERLRKALLDQKEWLPILQIGGVRVSKGSFSDRGDVNESPNLDPRSKLQGGLGRGLGGLGSADVDPAQSKSTLSALWLDIEIRAPGRVPRRIRREILDLLGPAARASQARALEVSEARRIDRAAQLFGPTEILVQSCRLTPELSLHSDTQELLEKRSLLRALATEKDPVRWKETMGPLAWNATRDKPLESFAHLRFAMSRFPGHVFLDRPNIVTHTRRYGWDASKGFTARSRIDVAANEVAVRQGAPAAPSLVRLEQGVVDTLAEDLALGAFGDGENTATLFAAADARGTPPALLQGKDAKLESLLPTLDGAQRLREDLARGYAAAVPQKPVALAGEPRSGWWRIDLKTGDTIGVMDSGFNSNTGEYTETTVITTREQALRRYLEWFTKQPAGRIVQARYRGPGRLVDIAQMQRIQNLQRIASRVLAEMQYFGIGL